MIHQSLAEGDGTLFSPTSQPGSNDAGTDPFFIYDFAALFDAGDATFLFRRTGCSTNCFHPNSVAFP
jgi:hypothetical protein